MPTRVAFGLGSAVAPSGADVPIPKGPPSFSETITNSGTTARSAAPALVDGIVRVVCDVDAWVTVGDSSVTASATTGWPVIANLPQDFGVAVGQYVAIINA